MIDDLPCITFTYTTLFCRRQGIKSASDLRKKKLDDSLLFAQFNRDIEEVRIHTVWRFYNAIVMNSLGL